MLSEGPIPPNFDVDDIAQECDAGEYVMGDVDRVQVALTGAEMAKALRSAGSTPSFFQLDDEGKSMLDDEGDAA